MALRINDIAPDFTASTTHGRMHFHTWLGDGWGILFSHPKDFTPVCTTELGALAGLKPEFERRNVKVVGLSFDPAEDHVDWLDNIEDVTGHRPDYPIIADADLVVAKLYDMLPAAAGDSAVGRSAADNATVRAVFIILPSVPNDEAERLFPKGWVADKPYLRRVPDPSRDRLFQTCRLSCCCLTAMLISGLLTAASSDGNNRRASHAGTRCQPSERCGYRAC